MHGRHSLLRSVIAIWVVVGADSPSPAAQLPGDRPATQSVASNERSIVKQRPRSAEDTVTSAVVTSDEPRDGEEAATLQANSAVESEVSCVASRTATTRWWVRADYSLWWLKGNRLPPLLTASPLGTPRDDAGVLGLNSTAIRFGDGRVDDDVRQGGQLHVGYWLNDAQNVGLEFSFLGLAGDNTHFVAPDPSDAIIARPFDNVASGLPDSQLVNYPGVVLGTFRVDTASELFSAGALLRRTWHRGPGGYVDLVGGYRFCRFRESLRMEETLVSQDPGGWVPLDTQLVVRDDFAAQTDFHGGEIGVAGEFLEGPFSLEILTRLGMGNAHQRLRIDGTTQVTPPGVPTATANSGFLAVSGTNIGDYTIDQFAFLPELDVTLNCQLTQCLTLQVGYGLLCLTDVLRTGDQIDPAVNPTYLPGSLVPPTGDPRPAPRLSSTTLWAQGVNLGLVLEY